MYNAKSDELSEHPCLNPFVLRNYSLILSLTLFFVFSEISFVLLINTLSTYLVLMHFHNFFPSTLSNTARRSTNNVYTFPFFSSCLPAACCRMYTWFIALLPSLNPACQLAAFFSCLSVLTSRAESYCRSYMPYSSMLCLCSFVIFFSIHYFLLCQPLTHFIFLFF